MEKQTTSNQGPKGPPPVVDLEEFDEELVFRPLTKGLGFNQDYQKEAGPLDSPPPFVPRTDVREEKKESLLAKDNHPAEISRPPEPPSMGSLDLIYRQQQAQPSVMPASMEQPPAVKQIAYEQADFIRRFFAWVIDVTVVTFLFAVSLVSIILVAGVNLPMLVNSIAKWELAASGSLIYTLIYVLYFTLSNMAESSSIGKNLTSIDMVSDKGQRLTMGQAMGHTLLTMVAVIGLWIPLLFRWHDSFTEIKVVKQK